MTAITVALAIVATAAAARWAMHDHHRARQRRPSFEARSAPDRRPSWLHTAAARIDAWPPLRRLAARIGARSYDRGLALALEAAARQLRSGAAVRDAVSEAGRVAGGPAGADLRLVAAEGGIAGMETALSSWVRRRPADSVRFTAAVLAVGFRTGGATASALDGAAAAVRQRLAVVEEARSLTAQARLSARVLGVAPAAFALVVSAIDPRVASFLVSTPMGLMLLAGGLALDLAGMVWMRRLVLRSFR